MESVGRTWTKRVGRLNLIRHRHQIDPHIIHSCARTIASAAKTQVNSSVPPAGALTGTGKWFARQKAKRFTYIGIGTAVDTRHRNLPSVSVPLRNVPPIR